MTASGWRKLGLAVVIGYLFFLAWMNRHSSNYSWVSDFGGGISSNDDESSSGSASASSEDDDSSASCDVEADGD